VLYPECVKRGVDIVPDYYTAYVDVRHAFARLYGCDEVNMALNEMMAGVSPSVSQQPTPTTLAANLPAISTNPLEYMRPIEDLQTATLHVLNAGMCVL
jgi:hypothetical protein